MISTFWCHLSLSHKGKGQKLLVYLSFHSCTGVSLTYNPEVEVLAYGINASVIVIDFVLFPHQGSTICPPTISDWEFLFPIVLPKAYLLKFQTLLILWMRNDLSVTGFIFVVCCFVFFLWTAYSCPLAVFLLDLAIFLHDFNDLLIS